MRTPQAVSHLRGVLRSRLGRRRPGRTPGGPVRIAITQPYVPEYRLGLWGPLIEQLASDGIEAHVFWGGSKRAIAAAERRGDLTTPRWSTRVPTVAIPWSKRFPPLTFRRLPRHWRRPAVVLTEMQVTNANAWWALLRRTPFVTMGHGSSGTTTGSALGSALESIQNRGAHHVLTYTPQGRDDVGRLARVPLGRISSFDNATDTGRLRAALDAVDDTALDSLRRSHGLPADAHIALALGALEPYKRVDLLLEAARLVFEADPSWYLVVAGDGSLASTVREAAARMPNLVMLGRVAPDGFAAAARLASVILNPGRVGLVAVDALTIGAPLLTTHGAQHAPEHSYLREGEDVITVDATAADFADKWLRMTRPNGTRANRPVLDSRRSAAIIAGVLRAVARG